MIGCQHGKYRLPYVYILRRTKRVVNKYCFRLYRLLRCQTVHSGNVVDDSNQKLNVDSLRLTRTSNSLLISEITALFLYSLPLVEVKLYGVHICDHDAEQLLESEAVTDVLDPLSLILVGIRAFHYVIYIIRHSLLYKFILHIRYGEIDHLDHIIAHRDA